MIEDEDDEPELRGYEPFEPRAQRGRKPPVLMRVIVIIGIVVLVLPGLIVIAGMTAGAAEISCARYTAFYAPEARGHTARFELFSPAGISWNCYSIASGGQETLLIGFGPIPGPVQMPSAPLQTS